MTRLVLFAMVPLLAGFVRLADPSTPHIADLDDEMGGSGSGGKTQGQVGVWVHDDKHRPAPQVRVRAAWSGAITGTSRCTTDDQGYCKMESRPFDNEQGVQR